MIFVYKDRIIQIEWSIFRGTSQVPEDFSRALVKLFLVGNYEKYAVPVTAGGGTLVAQMPQDLPDGAYSLEAIWVKNYNNLFPVRGTDTPSVGSRNIRYPGPCHNDYGMTHPWDHRSNDRCLMRSRKEYVFAVTSYPGEETAVNQDGYVTIKISSAVATYGYDGLSAYEIAVMRGDFNGTEKDFLAKNIINNPDNEDLTIAKEGGYDVIKFADKEYNALNHSGLGRVYLRKNIVSSINKNILTQDMIKKTNTRYIIQYDYDLGGETITVPEGCILEFEGGSLGNGVLSGDYKIEGMARINTIAGRNALGSINISSGYGTFIEGGSGFHADIGAQDLSNLGISYVIYYGHYRGATENIEEIKKDCSILALYGIGVIMSLNDVIEPIETQVESVKDIENIIGWYVYDEPDAENTRKSIEEQDERIAYLKSVRNIPCCCSATLDDWNVNHLSLNYDFIFISQYQYSGKFEDLNDILIKYACLNSFAFYTVDKLIPCFETFKYDGFDEDDNLFDRLLIKKRLYGGNKGAFFIYDNSTHTGFVDNPKLRNIVKAIKSFPVIGASLDIVGITQNNTSKSTCYEKLLDYPHNNVGIGTSQFNYDGYLLYLCGYNCYFTIKLNKKTSVSRVVITLYKSTLQNEDLEFELYTPMTENEGIYLGSLNFNTSGDSTVYQRMVVVSNYSDRILVKCKQNVRNVGLLCYTVVGIEGEDKSFDINDAQEMFSEYKGLSTSLPSMIYDSSNYVVRNKGKKYYATDLGIELTWDGERWRNPLGTQYQSYKGKNRPNIVGNGQIYYEEEYQKPIFLIEGKWYDYYGNEGDTYNHGDVLRRPNNALIGTTFFNTSYGAFEIWDGEKWVNPQGLPSNIWRGSTAERPSLASDDFGYEYYDYDLKKKILWNGSAWVNMDGTPLS